MRVTQRVQRRSFLRAGIASAGTLALPFLFARGARARPLGPLVPDPDNRLDLPAGFSYRVLDQGGQTMTDGYRVPGNPDGMACFPGSGGTLVLLRNHELTVSSRGPYSMTQTPPSQAYDSAVVGGVTRLVIDQTTFARVSSNLVLVGTAQNCAGGPSPWGWLSCEETFDAQHGYTFVCPVGAASVATPQRIVGYGHFRHEAVAIDPSGNVAYLTEDRPDSALYRFVPDSPSTPFAGTLQALRVRGQNGFSTVTGLSVGQVLEVDWVDLDDPDPATDTLRATARAAGAAVISRGEGIWFDRGVVYFTSTNGGPIASGQVFALRPTPTGGTLTLVAQSEDATVLDGPDNLCMAPWGDLFIAEDAGSENYLRGLTPTGAIYDFARTTLSELAGVCFSPDGRALFVNIWGADTTLVVTGPFPTSNPDGGAGGSGGTGGSSGTGGSGGTSSGTGGSPGAAGENDGAGAPGGGQAGEASGGASGDGTGGAGGTGGKSGATGGSGGRSGASSGGSGAGGKSGSGVAPAAPRTSDDPGCGCETPGRR